MKIIIVSVIIVLVATVSHAHSINGYIKRVIDGDTFVMDDNSDTRIRLCGINAPELKKSGGLEAKIFLENLVKDKKVTCHIVEHGTPCDGHSPIISHNRINAQCFTKNDISGCLVREGYAKDSKRFSGGYYSKSENQKCN